jgi:hypothetical protein
MFQLQEKPSALKREHPALQKMKFIKKFLCLWFIFALLDPDMDPETPLYPDPIRIRKRIRIRIHSTALQIQSLLLHVYHLKPSQSGLEILAHIVRKRIQVVQSSSKK